MFTTPIDAILYGLRISKFMVHRFVDDLKPQEFEYQPCPGANCAAWILGHLTLTDRRQITWLGGQLPAVPDGFAEKFATTRKSAEQQSGFGDPKIIVEAFDAHREALIVAVPLADPAKFREPPAFQTPMFQNRGEATLFMALHTSMHMGQLSIIRRMLGYPPVS